MVILGAGWCCGDSAGVCIEAVSRDIRVWASFGGAVCWAALCGGVAVFGGVLVLGGVVWGRGRMSE